uniref:Uncharacterized protein n=1 Tax=Cacopsylla melanoneura TaxID=428564 RepID=A0A8D8RCR1_9HEMI
MPATHSIDLFRLFYILFTQILYIVLYNIVVCCLHITQHFGVGTYLVHTLTCVVSRRVVRYLYSFNMLLTDGRVGGCYLYHHLHFNHIINQGCQMNLKTKSPYW